ncbi:tripartite tricarboxylate transporter TctB family protein [Sinorhizobium meliloti]|jgi:putative tricarboxylic transport membrane protein|uniref:tripartite tricarboxylate transporter TctB family protein n=1 Tax=Rhizobium meliloti TaxID=382 RepID=UPI000FD45BA0|nr:tripartite tricarboxylate transporter TctB family protein [Sinorhizobium meliloti]MQV20495.1 tripartite tricarboxylate transporter TctB family protein [Sinorhizobium meliloti]MQV33057.1 tripartite tricarboxylate transporter TctB family protein [Sinorhizobium meliloti]RVE85675.1 tripartite tricarboxylate transporter TctB family protein [Sinorhizobium meliloti]RVG49048.1 tripartite tricarboxylate transporter TctB family protein [Sinorhizobium meliloti]RVM03706.1 tripartite tricarboxylate tran
MKALTARPQLVTVSLIVLAVGAAVSWIATTIPVGSGVAVIGPRSFPLAVGLLLISCGLLLLLEASRAPWDCEATNAATPKLDLVPLGILACGMIVNVLLIKSAGFILASTLMFAFTAKAFGARRLWLSLLIGFVLALATYYGFARMLDLRIGGGFIEDLF